MIRLAIVVEGETEENFVAEVLTGHLRTFEVEPAPFLIDGRGGNVTVDRLAANMAKAVWSFDFVTSLVDFYGFSSRSAETPEALRQRISAAVDRRINRSWNQSRVFPYIQLYEFEGLLFSDVTAFARLPITPDGAVENLARIRARFPTPEDINDNPATAPSKRIASLIPGYNKKVNGPELAAAIGLDVIRAHCRRFSHWLSHLESLNAPTLPA